MCQLLPLLPAERRQLCSVCHGRYAEKLWGSDITCLKELAVISAEHLGQMGVGNPAHAAIIKEHAKADLGARTACLGHAGIAAAVLCMHAPQKEAVAVVMTWKLPMYSLHSHVPGDAMQQPGMHAGQWLRRKSPRATLMHAGGSRPCLP